MKNIFSASFIALIALVAVAPTASHDSPFLFVAADLVQVGLKSGMGADFIVGPARAASWAPMETEAPPAAAPAPAPAAAGGGGGGIAPGSSIVVLQGGAVVGPGGFVAVPQQQPVPVQQPFPVQQPVPAVQAASQSQNVAAAAAATAAGSCSSSSSSSSSPVASPAMAYVMLDNYAPPTQGLVAAVSAASAAATANAGAEQGEKPGFGAAAPPAASF